MKPHNNQPYYQETVLYRWGLFGLALENILFKLLNRRSDSDILEYPETDRMEMLRPRSFVMRYVDCGSCGGCELALQRVNNPVWDIQKFNINFESSPRAAHALAMIGPYVINSTERAQRAYDAMPVGAIVLIGDCTIDGGRIRGAYSLATRPDWFQNPIDVIPGCPPSIPVIEEKLLEISQKVKLTPHWKNIIKFLRLRRYHT